MDITPKQKEKVNLFLRFFISTVGGGLIATFSSFTLLVNLTNVATFVLLMFLIGILIGMYNTEIHYAIISGFLAIFVGLTILFGTIYFAVALFAAWSLLDILILIAVDILVRVFMLQLLGIMPGTVIGRLFGPEWFEPITKHKLKVGIDGNSVLEPE
ncbi:MAG: hypothetical protein ACFFD8_06115 [Candidatus Thorarchaeota archaeon]